MNWKVSGMFVIMLLVLMAFAFSGVATAMTDGSGTMAGRPPCVACKTDSIDSIGGVIASMEYDTMIKYDLLAPGINEKGSSISPVACNGKNHRHYVLASLEWPDKSPLSFAENFTGPGIYRLE